MEITSRSNCRFALKRTTEGKPLILVHLYQDTIPALKNATVGFELLGGTGIEQASKLIDALNERILAIFVTTSEKP